MRVVRFLPIVSQFNCDGVKSWYDFAFFAQLLYDVLNGCGVLFEMMTLRSLLEMELV